MIIKTITNLLMLTIISTFATTITTCFTPGENCTAQIVHAINTAKKSIYIQAYSFTSTPIAKALINAKNRKVTILILLDKSNTSAKYSKIKALYDNHIPFLIDNQPTIAHNKIIIIDKLDIITGSFNFTNAAQKRNAENIIIIKNNQQVTNAYLKNFQKRKKASITLERYCQISNSCKNNITYHDVKRSTISKKPSCQGSSDSL